MNRRHTFEPRTLKLKIRRSARHLAPKKRPHVTVPVPKPVAANVAPLWPVGGQPTWDIFEPDSEAWVDSWLSAGERRGIVSLEKAA